MKKKKKKKKQTLFAWTIKHFCRWDEYENKPETMPEWIEWYSIVNYKQINTKHHKKYFICASLGY